VTATLAEMADELAATIENALSASAEEIQVYGRRNFNPDSFAIDIYPADPFGNTEGAGFGDVTVEFDWIVRARISGDRDAEQDLLLQLMDPADDLSVAVALLDDPTLNGLASTVEVDGPSGHIQYVEGEGSRIGVQWTVRVLRVYS